MSIWASEDSSVSKELLSSSTRNPYINAERGGERLFLCMSFASDFTKAVRGDRGNYRPMSPTSPYLLNLVETIHKNRVTKQLEDSDIC